MMADPLRLAGLALTALSALLSAIVWLFRRMDGIELKLRRELAGTVGELRDQTLGDLRRVSAALDNCVRRDDYAREMALLNTHLEGLREEIRHGNAMISARLDQFLFHRPMRPEGNG